MSWNHGITIGDVVFASVTVIALCLLVGAVLLLWHYGKEFVTGLREGWNKSGKSFRDEVRERAEKKRRAS